ncbi:sulfite exporter TauE/SafE family protein [uncultured Dysgonomonas sp.]|uniref:sulfite exporter TauE/SafE family protein n=1 Tax=uncultured Dysgonomonas sp. TaxID=206096 RepID=UPI0026264CA5|nr:sulfite exporter TauE/SafE family protein [uncultured Dysgonomonas sp.]
MAITLLILFAVSWLAAAISGIAGFGGALLLLPVISHFIGIKAAIPVLTIAQLFGNASRVWFGRKQLQWNPILFFLAGSIPFSIIGSRMLVSAPSELLLKGVGVLLLLIVMYRRSGLKVITTNYKWLVVGGIITGFLSGIAGSAGPLGAACFISLNLNPIAYISSEAFTALSMHITKTIVYQKYALIGTKELGYGLVCGVAMIIGSYTGKKLIEHLSKDKFQIVVDILLVLSGFQMIIA